MTAMMAVMIPVMTTTASAQTRKYARSERSNYEYNRNSTRQYRERNTRYDDRYDEPNVYDRHRKAINIGAATGAGAIIGALLGGKKGALIGAAAGVATGAIVTKVQKPRNTDRYRY